MNNTNKSPTRMTLLLNKIERRLGLSVLTLPNELSKDSWHTIIEEETLPTFSRYFPNKIPVIIDNNCYKDGYYFIDTNIPEGVNILGIKDIDWETCSSDLNFNRYNVDMYNSVYMDFAAENIAFCQVSADFMSLFSVGIYPEFKEPNKIILKSAAGAIVRVYRPFPITVFVEHQPNLMTISPTMMTTFENLAISDVATFLYQNLKYYDNLDTVFGNLDLKLDTLQDYSNKREDIVNKLEESYVSTANASQSMIMTV